MIHTQGPWKVVPRETMEDGSVYPMHITGGVSDFIVCMLEAQAVAEAYASGVWSESTFPNLGNAKHCNARLIAAAPDLLAALQFIADSEEYDGDSFVCDFATLQGVARAAIAKATGGA
jgi:hypothetical protein